MTFNHKPNLQLDFFLWSKPFVVQVYFDLKKSSYDCQSYLRAYLSSEFWARQAQREEVKMKNFDFSY